MRIPILVYLGVVLVFAALQRQLIFPGAASRGRSEARVQPGVGAELVALKTADGDRIVALFGPALGADGRPDPHPERCPTILFFYGNGMNLAASGEEFDMFRRLGCNVMIPEYVGYGMSSGTAGERGCYATADAVYEHSIRRKDIDPKRIAVGGWSLGGAVAIDLAARREVAGVFAFSTFTSMTDLGRVHYPMLPVGLVLRHRFDSLGNIGRIRVPILLGHGGSDELVPAAMSEKLAGAARAPVSRFVVAGAGHNDFFAVGSGKVREELGRFLEGVVGSGR